MHGIAAITGNMHRSLRYFVLLERITSSSCNAQYFHTTEHTYARLTFVVSLVDNEFSSKYCCVGLITVTNSV